MDRVEGAGRKFRKEKGEGIGEKRLGRRKEKGLRKVEEIRNKGKKVGERRQGSPSAYIC